MCKLVISLSTQYSLPHWSWGVFFENLCLMERQHAAQKERGGQSPQVTTFSLDLSPLNYVRIVITTT